MLTDEVAGFFNLIKLFQVIRRCARLHCNSHHTLNYSFRAAAKRTSHVYAVNP